MSVIQKNPITHNQYEALGNTKIYFRNIAKLNFSLASFAAKISAIAFPLFAMITLFTLVADIFASISNNHKVKAKELEYDESISSISNMFEAHEISKPIVLSTIFETKEVNDVTKESKQPTPAQRKRKAKQAEIQAFKAQLATNNLTKK